MRAGRPRCCCLYTHRHHCLPVESVRPNHRDEHICGADHSLQRGWIVQISNHNVDLRCAGRALRELSPHRFDLFAVATRHCPLQLALHVQSWC